MNTKKKLVVDQKTAIKANRKAIQNLQKEMVSRDNRLLRRINNVEKTQAKHTEILEGHSRKLDEHTEILEQHTEILEDHGRKLDEHTELLEQHTKILEDHGRKLDENSQKIEGNSRKLDNLEHRMNHGFSIVMDSLADLKSMISSKNNVVEFQENSQQRPGRNLAIQTSSSSDSAQEKDRNDRKIPKVS